VKFPRIVSKSKAKPAVIEVKAKPPISEARRQLADLIEARAALVAKVETLHAAAKKLDAKRGEAAPIEAEIQKLDAIARPRSRTAGEGGPAVDAVGAHKRSP
jgi:exoribonuclease R